jgi:hypothetical protein
MPNPCVSCTRNVTRAGAPGLSCVGCSRYWHWKCAGLSEVTFKTIVTNKLSWTCKSCPRRSNILPSQPSPSSLSVPSPALKVPISPSVKSPIAALVAPASKATKTGPKSTAPKNPPASTKLLTDRERISKLEEQLAAALNRIDFLESQLSDNSSSITTLISKAEECGSKLGSEPPVETSLSDSLEIQCLPESALLNPSLAIDTVSEQIGFQEQGEFLSSDPTRINNRLLIKFKSPDCRRNFLLAAKQFNREKKKLLWNSQSFRIHVNEELTSTQKALYRETKTFARINSFKFVWIGISGQIFLKKSEGHEPFIISSSSCLAKLSDAPILSKCARPENKSSPGSAACSSKHA